MNEIPMEEYKSRYVKSIPSKKEEAKLALIGECLKDIEPGYYIVRYNEKTIENDLAPGFVWTAWLEVYKGE